MLFYLPDLSKNGFVETPVKIRNKQFYFIFRWNNYCECAFLRILDADRNSLLDETACRNGLIIKLDERVLPVLELKGNEYPPLRETFKDYYIEWQQ